MCHRCLSMLHGAIQVHFDVLGEEQASLSMHENQLKTHKEFMLLHGTRWVTCRAFQVVFCGR